MSGTSTDGVDGVLCRFGNRGMDLIAHRSIRFDARLRRDILALNTTGPDELRRAAAVAHRLAVVSARLVTALLAESRLTPSDIVAIGSHGQTVRHCPPRAGRSSPAYSLQVNNPALLAELSGIDVIADFRNGDIAAGGQGAPLVPGFHQAFFGRPGKAIVVANIGGISNLTVLRPGQPLLGFDCGPGNVLLDAWCGQQLGLRFDRNGAWASGGHVNGRLLARLMRTPFLKAPPPKSTGRDLFSFDWLESHIESSRDTDPRDVQATLAEFTAMSMTSAVRAWARGADELVVCGGGAFNVDLMRRLRTRMPHLTIKTSADYGLGPDQVEAAAFAWLAMRRVRGSAGNISEATGASGPRILGAWYPRPPV